MSIQNIEIFMAKLYTDHALLSQFLNDKKTVARDHGFTELECLHLDNIDEVGLIMAANSFTKKRHCSKKHEPMDPNIINHGVHDE